MLPGQAHMGLISMQTLFTCSPNWALRMEHGVYGTPGKVYVKSVFISRRTTHPCILDHLYDDRGAHFCRCVRRYWWSLLTAYHLVVNLTLVSRCYRVWYARCNLVHRLKELSHVSTGLLCSFNNAFSSNNTSWNAQHYYEELMKRVN